MNMNQRACRLARVLWLGLCVWVLMPATGSAQSLLEAFEAARVSDTRLRAARAEFQAVQTSVDQARAAFMPTARLDLEKLETRQRTLSGQSSLLGGTSGSVVKYPTSTRTFSLTQPLFRKDAIHRLSQAKASVRQAHFVMLAAEQDLLLRTTSAYLGLMAATENLELVRAEREVVTKALEFARERLLAGVGTIINQVDAQARHAVTQAREIEARNRVLDAEQALREITGLSINRIKTLREDFKPVPPDPASAERWLESALTRNLGLSARREAVEVSREEIDRQKAGHYPSLNLVLQNTRRDAGYGVLGSASKVDSTDLLLKLSVPLFEGGLTSAATREAVHRLRKVEADLETELRAVERAITVYHDSVLVGVGLVDALKQLVEAQASAVEAKDLSFKSGLITLLPVLDAQRDFYQARKEYQQSRYDYLLNRMRLQQAAGTLSETELQEINLVLK